MKNISLPIIVTLSIVSAAVETHCMSTKASTVLKKAISALGTTLGLGLPTVPHIVDQAHISYNDIYKNPTATIPNTQALSPEEESFYRQYVSKNRELRKVSNCLDCQCNRGNLIIVSDSISYKDGTITFSEALALKDTEALKTFAALAEHEEAHAKYYHSYITSLVGVITPCAITGIAAKTFKKTFPLETSLKHISGRAATKTVGALGILVVTHSVEPVINTTVHHTHEVIADANIGADRIDAEMKYLQLLEKKYNINNDLWYSSQSSMEKRIKRLRAKTQKT